MRAYSLINNADLQLRRVLLEIRFSRSGAFYSRFGKIIDVLADARPDWFFNPDTKNGLTGNFVCVASGLDASVGETRITVNLAPKPDLAAYDTEEISDFANECMFLADVYTNNVQPAERTRIGFRQFYEADFDSEDDANRWVLGLGILPPVPSLSEAFTGQPTDLNFNLVIEGQHHFTRLALSTSNKEALIDRGDAVATVRSHMLSKKQKEALLEAERRSAWMRRKRSATATLDIDSYIEAPSEDVLTNEFIKSQFRDEFKKFATAVNEVKS